MLPPLEHSDLPLGGINTVKNFIKYGSYVQDEFDPRIYSVHTHVDQKKLERGRIVSKMQGNDVGVRFLYNPTELSLSYSTDPTQAQLPADAKNPNDFTPLFGTVGTGSFSLLFDRTYEVWDTKYRNQKVGKYGVYVDIRQFYKLFGIVPDDWSALTDDFRLQSSPMRMVPVMIFFGGARSMKFYGVVTGFTVTYTHWSQQMTPTRAVVNVSFENWIPSWLSPDLLQAGADTATTNTNAPDTGSTPQFYSGGGRGVGPGSNTSGVFQQNGG